MLCYLTKPNKSTQNIEFSKITANIIMDEEVIIRIVHNRVVYLLQYDCRVNKEVKRIQLHFLTGDGQLLK